MKKLLLGTFFMVGCMSLATAQKSEVDPRAEAKTAPAVSSNPEKVAQEKEQLKATGAKDKATVKQAQAKNTVAPKPQTEEKKAIIEKATKDEEKVVVKDEEAIRKAKATKVNKNVRKN